MIDDGFEKNPGISRQALAALHQGAFGWALSLTAYDDQLAEDVMQQAYLALIEGKARYDGRSALKTWLYAVIRNTARRQLRSRRLEQEKTDEYAASMGAEMIEPAPSEAPSPLLRDAVRGLSPRQREVLELVIDADFSIEQAAQILGISTGSARTHYHRAKQTLRQQLEGHHGRG